jgi:hypothetical protein
MELCVRKSSSKGFGGLLKKILLSGVGILFTGMVISPVAGAGEPDLAGMPVLKHRVSVVSLSELSRDKQKASLVLKNPDPLVYFQEEGVMMDLNDWASVVDLAKSELTKSDCLRVMELPKSLSRKDIDANSSEQPALVMLLSYGTAGKERRLYSRLIELSSGQSVFSTESAGPDLRIAVRESLRKIENWLLTQAWRGRVIGVRNDEMVINRGRLDGLREGARLIGYSLKGAAKGTKESEEALLLRYGDRLGTYTVVEARNNYAKVKLTEGKRLLAEGDILEMPEMRLIERDIRTRGNRMWDKIYEK